MRYALQAMFLDEVTIRVKAGDGGDGLVSFRREKYEPRGGPNGGDGGRGGDVVFQVAKRLNTLRHFDNNRLYQAENGKRGGSSNKTGASGTPTILEVPPGTIVRDSETGDLIADLTGEAESAIVAFGGRGGRGNARFKSSTHQAPRIAERGEPGEERSLALELKLIADVGIIGVPNAGKSTLLSVISGANPKIANYPFTTLVPNLGVVTVDYQDIIFADIPGLVEGAHEGIGLGHSFLRHVQRTRLLVHLLDGAGENPIADYNQINTELALFDENLSDRVQIVVLNKIELPDAQAHWDAVEKVAEEDGYPAFAISAVTREGLQPLLYAVQSLLEELPAVEVLEEVPVFTLEDEEIFEVTIEEDGFRVAGKRVERAAAMTYWEYDEAVVRFHRILTALGIADALRDAGVEEGDTVYIGDIELEWVD